jgi:hypothetical protein
VNLIDNQGYLGDFASGATIYFMFTTNGADGESKDFSGSSVIYIYKQSDLTERSAGITITIIGSADGLYGVDIAQNSDFYVTNETYNVTVRDFDMGTELYVDAVIGSFSIERKI